MRPQVLKLIIVCMLVAGGIYLWCAKVEPLRQNRAFYYRTRAAIESLLDRRPINVDEKHWQNWIGWTLNAHANTVPFYPKIPRDEMDGFESELARKMDGQVDVQTLEWIWDELVRLVPNGESYSDRFRPTSATRLTPFENEPLLGFPPREAKAQN